MNRYRLRAGYCARAMAGFALLIVLSGCNYLLLGMYLIGGPPSVEPLFDTETGLSMTDKDVTVAVVCVSPPDVRFAHSKVDHELGQFVASRMHLKGIQVINPDRIRDWLDKHPDWDTPDEIGAAFGVTYVVYIELNDFQLYEKHSERLFRGRSEVQVSVWQMEGETGEQIYSYDLESLFPRQIARSTFDTKYTTFKREYMEVLSEDIGQLFYEHYHGDDIPNAN